MQRRLSEVNEKYKISEKATNAVDEFRFRYDRRDVSGPQNCSCSQGRMGRCKSGYTLLSYLKSMTKYKIVSEKATNAASSAWNFVPV